jgi:hypothetical protein
MPYRRIVTTFKFAESALIRHRPLGRNGLAALPNKYTVEQSLSWYEPGPRLSRHGDFIFFGPGSEFKLSLSHESATVRPTRLAFDVDFLYFTRTSKKQSNLHMIRASETVAAKRSN